MPIKTFTNGSVLTDDDLNTYLMQQTVIRCTSGTRPASPVAGMLIYETDTDLYRRWLAGTWDFVAVGQKILAAGLITAQSSGSNSGTSVPVFRFDDIPIRPNRNIHIVATDFGVTASNNQNSALVRWTATEDGSTPTVSSTEIGRTSVRIEISAAYPTATWTSKYRSPATPVTLSLLMSISRTAGSNTVYVQPSNSGIEILVLDMGPAPSYTGTVL
ncbi:MULTISPECIES: hypothetical protein [Catenuloplanes]|uniref:Uncharacterized protein n=1 Tax=Catenuloplanes niger TaxID=587534 RepID=A0AAE4CW23_9ACTN|nr:hypothetical protein [Catenuloplanes niger]MDR7323369.1 hypothetical protein [Catenuloplanes niger]